MPDENVEPVGFPWTIVPCTAKPSQFLIYDSLGRLVCVGETGGLDGLKQVLEVLQENPKIRIETTQFEERFVALQAKKDAQREVTSKKRRLKRQREAKTLANEVTRKKVRNKTKARREA